MRVYKRGTQFWVEFYCRIPGIARYHHRFPTGDSENMAINFGSLAQAAIVQERFDGTKDSIIGIRNPDNVKPITLNDLAGEWMDSKANIERSSQEYYDTHANAIKAYFSAELVNGRWFHQITKKEVSAFLAERYRTCAASTANSTRRALRQMYEFAIANQHATEDYTEGWDTKKEEEREIFLTVAEFESILSSVPEWLHAFLITAVYTAARKGELLGMTWDAVDFAAKKVTFPKTKNHKKRTVPMADRVRDQLLTLESRKVGKFVFLDPDINIKKRTRMKIAPGVPMRMNEETIRYRFNLATRGLGIYRMMVDPVTGETEPEYPHVHDLRHTAASWLLQRGMPLATLQKLLGHAKITQTMRYAHLVEADLDVASTIFNAMDAERDAAGRRKVGSIQEQHHNRTTSASGAA
jgi:integrase